MVSAIPRHGQANDRAAAQLVSKLIGLTADESRRPGYLSHSVFWIFIVGVRLLNELEQASGARAKKLAQPLEPFVDSTIDFIRGQPGELGRKFRKQRLELQPLAKRSFDASASAPLGQQ